MQVLWNHYATWWEDLSEQGQTVLSEGIEGLGVPATEQPGRGRVGDGEDSEDLLPWGIPASKERTTGFEPATFGLGSRRSTN